MAAAQEAQDRGLQHMHEREARTHKVAEEMHRRAIALHEQHVEHERAQAEREARRDA